MSDGFRNPYESIVPEDFYEGTIVLFNGLGIDALDEFYSTRPGDEITKGIRDSALRDFYSDNGLKEIERDLNNSDIAHEHPDRYGGIAGNLFIPVKWWVYVSNR